MRMADVRLHIASREYIVTCRDGEEDHLLSLGATVSEMVEEAGGSTGGLNESRQFLYAALLLADKLQDAASNRPVAPSPGPLVSDERSAQAAAALDRLADRLEMLADKLEN
jgi:cell division protein ZapA